MRRQYMAFRIVMILAMILASNITAYPDDQIIFRDAAGRKLTAKDLDGISGKVNYEIVGAGTIPEAARRLHEAGRRAGAAGRYGEALGAFEQAHKMAPSWPYPVYESAWTYLLMGDDTRAEEKYKEVDKLAPRGYFTTKTALDCLRRERNGEIGPGSYKILVLFEDRPESERRRVLSALVEKWPRFPAAWQKLSLVLNGDNNRLAAIERGVMYGPDDETKGELLVNKALVLDRQGKRSDAVNILGSRRLIHNRH